MARVTEIGGIFFKSGKQSKHAGGMKRNRAANFMVNYRVDDLDGILAELGKAGVTINPHREEQDYGRFAGLPTPMGIASSHGGRQ
jgi:hypothetical protein